MLLDDFLKIAKYANKNWKGGFTPKEIAENAKIYYEEWELSKEQGKATYTMEELCKLLIEDIENGSEEAEEFLFMILSEAEDTWVCGIYHCENCRKREIVFLTEEQIIQLDSYHNGNPSRLLIQDILSNCSQMVREYEREYRYCLCEECWQKYWNGQIK